MTKPKHDPYYGLRELLDNRQEHYRAYVRRFTKTLNCALRKKDFDWENHFMAALRAFYGTDDPIKRAYKEILDRQRKTKRKKHA